MQRRDTAVGLFFVVLFAAALTAAAVTGVVAAPDPVQKVAAPPQPPVRITADEAEYFNKEGRAIFSGNVVAVQTDSTIAAERMEVFFEKPANAEGKLAVGIGAPASAQRIGKIVAEKSVSFRQIDPETGKERYATGDKGVYDVEQQLLTMSGSPRLWEGKNVIVGEEMFFYLVDKRMIVKGKVNLTVFPDELKEAKKP